jgi:uncharacterized membrane protein
MVYSPPIFRSLYAFAASALIGALATDLAYWRTADFIWVEMSDWLVTIGAVVGFVALLVGIVETIVRREARTTWVYGLFSLVGWALSVLNALVHTRDGWTSVVPLGLILSVLTVLCLAFAGRALQVRPAYYNRAEAPT